MGSGEEPHIRDGAIWIRDNIPDGGQFLTLDIRTANIIKYYSNNNAFSLHSNENPAYNKVENRDLAILHGEIDYLVYEVYLAEQVRYLKEEESEMKETCNKIQRCPSSY